MKLVKLDQLSPLVTSVLDPSCLCSAVFRLLWWQVEVWDAASLDPGLAVLVLLEPPPPLESPDSVEVLLRRR